MDVIVTWNDGSTNCVCSKELRPVRKSQRITLGTKVKMYYNSKWYYGRVTVIETEEGCLKSWPVDSTSLSDSNSDDIPLSILNEQPHDNLNNEQNYVLPLVCNDESTLTENLSVINEQTDNNITTNMKTVSMEPEVDKKESVPQNNNLDITVNPKELYYEKEAEMQQDEQSFIDTVQENQETDFNPHLTSDLASKCTGLLRSNELLTSTSMDVCDDEDDVLSRIANIFTKPVDVDKSNLTTEYLIGPDMTNTADKDYEDAETYCPSDRSSPELFGDISDLNDPDYVPIYRDVKKSQRKAKSKHSTFDCYALQTCEVVNCEREVFSTCHRCLALLCWEHFEQDTDCLVHQIISTEIPQVPNHHETIRQTCEVASCKQDVFSSCFRCSALLCWKHFEENNTCCSTDFRLEESENSSPTRLPQNQDLEIEYSLDGSRREFEIPKKKKENRRKIQKELRNTGQEYVSINTKKTVPAKELGPNCNVDHCKKMNRNCIVFTDDLRKNIHTDFYKLGDLSKQREYVARHVIETVPKQRTTQQGNSSRRTRSLHYYLTKDGTKVKVCRKLFLNTLSISEKMVRTCLDKINKTTGCLEKDHRGGRRESLAMKDCALRAIVKEHINRFPRVESHYCRANSSREYLHPDLTLQKMYRLLLEEQPDPQPSLTLYATVFKEMNLSFHHPKKDQCSLCATYKSGSSEVKERLHEKYTLHAIEKETVRALKREDKKRAKEDNNLRCSSFDLQQVIYLPISNESDIFYKRRLSVYNLTIYDIASRDCICFIWPQMESKRGASEISTALTLYLEKCDEEEVKSVNLYADGCAGQNKNSIVASALLHFINKSKNIKNISLRFFAPNHGQNEGDSAHSAISYAINKTGDVFIHTQLYPIIKMARPSQPYIVHPLEFKDFKDFKQMSINLKVLSIRKDNETDMAVNWKEIAEIKVEKSDPSTIFFKTSHVSTSYRSLKIVRTRTKYLTEELQQLHQTRVKIPKKKFEDLMKLCTGRNPIIRLEEYVKYYESLPHE